MLARLLCLLLLAAMPAGAETLWRGDFSGNWMDHWGVTWFEKLDVPVSIMEDPEHGTFLRVAFPAGAVREGYAFRTDLGEVIGKRERIYLSYWVRFSDGFEWRRGGKLPGLMAHDHGPISGCDMPDGTGGFSVRFTWWKRGQVNLYPYIPPQEGYMPAEDGCARSYKLDERARRGRWVHLVQLVQLNAPGEADGVIRAWLDGEQAAALEGVRFRDAGLGIDGIMFATFYGGKCCAPHEDGSHIDFAEFSLHDSNPLD